MAVLGPRPCARAPSSCGRWGPLFIVAHGPLTIAASLVAEHSLQTRRLSNCGSRAQLLRGMWDLPRPGLEPVSPALAGRLSTTVPPGKPLLLFFDGCFVFLSSFSSEPCGWQGLGAPARCWAEPTRWEGRVQDIGPPGTSRPHVISISESSPRDLSLNTKAQLHPTASRLQYWKPHGKQLARQEHNPTH